MLTAFISYAHEDEKFRERLEKQLVVLRRQGLLSTWHDRRITVGMNLHVEIQKQIENDDLIILLVSPDFIASDYCYEVELQRAMERHHAGQAVVVPVILRYCDWQNTPLRNLLAAPRDGKAITSWSDQDEAFLDVAQKIREAANRIVALAEARVDEGEDEEEPEDEDFVDLTLAQARKLLEGCSPKVVQSLRFIVRQGEDGFEISDLAEVLGVDLETSDLRGVWAGITKRTRTVTGNPDAYLIHWVGHDEGWTGLLSEKSYRSLKQAIGG